MTVDPHEIAGNKYLVPDEELWSTFDLFNGAFLVELDQLLRGDGFCSGGVTTYLSTPFGIMHGAGVVYVLDPGSNQQVFTVDADNFRFTWPNPNGFAGLRITPSMSRVTRLLLAGCSLNYVDTRVVGTDSRLYWAVCPEYFERGDDE